MTSIQTQGSFVVEAGRPVSFRLIDTDVVAFARGPLQVSLSCGSSAIVDPVAAAWCSAGSTSHWEAIETQAVRVDWFSSQPLDQPWIHGLSPVGLYYSPPRLFLRLRLLAESGSGPRSVLSVVREGMYPIGVEASRERPALAADPRGSSSLAESVREYLASSFEDPASVPQIARQLASSPAHMSRLFKRHTGLSILSYRHELRMRTALGRLDDETSALIDLAIELGYSSHSHFTEKFRQTFGMTPTQYRRLRSSTIAQSAFRPAASSSR